MNESNASGPSSSGRRLPPVPDEQVLSNASERNNESSLLGTSSYGPFFLEYTMLAEYNLVNKQKIPGVYILPSAEDASVWFGVLFVRQGLYRDGIYRFTLRIPDGFPDSDCPSVFFDPPVFHPLVDPESGELNVQRQFPKWRRSVHHIWQVLVYTRRAFHKLDIQSPVNSEAANLYSSDQAAFKRRVVAEIQLRKESIYDPPTSNDPLALRFSRWDQEAFEKAKLDMLKEKTEVESRCVTDSPVNGLSWMEPTSLQIFAKTP